jgi:citrate/tricarballylate utilization protein
MPERSTLEHAAHTMAVCNACRYCEQYCAVFPAMEQRLAFGKADLTYLANLCHNCGECLYACQYAPPHEFAINVPRTFAELRRESYEEHAWPRGLAAAYQRRGAVTSLLLAAAFSIVMAAGVFVSDAATLTRAHLPGDFYAVVPHAMMVGLFGAVGLFVTTALAVGVVRFWREMHRGAALPVRHGIARGVKDALVLRHLHASGADCTSAEETRTAWRRWFHHLTFYGFALCFASTTVAAIYHTIFGWAAPYAYVSAPVVLGTVGGVGLTVGPIGLWVMRGRRDPQLGDPDQKGLDASLVLLLALTSISGLLLLARRHTDAMPWLLVVHLGIVLALFVTLPYGKFVHGLYRTAALLKFSREDER